MYINLNFFSASALCKQTNRPTNDIDDFLTTPAGWSVWTWSKRCSGLSQCSDLWLRLRLRLSLGLRLKLRLKIWLRPWPNLKNRPPPESVRQPAGQAAYLKSRPAAAAAAAAKSQQPWPETPATPNNRRRGKTLLYAEHMRWNDGAPHGLPALNWSLTINLLIEVSGVIDKNVFLSALSVRWFLSFVRSVGFLLDLVLQFGAFCLA